MGIDEYELVSLKDIHTLIASLFSHGERYFQTFKCCLKIYGHPQL
jgi:hypothetical protein